jgi:predicted DNA-binding protein with PD1-like motif
MQMIAVCLQPGDDLRESIEKLVRDRAISAGTIISCVGALSQARLRMADTAREDQNVRDFDGPFEIVSLIGNVGPGRTHLHLSVADKDGRVIGGHVKTGGNIVAITAELVIAVEDSLRFIEREDPSVGWNNLVVEENV